MTSAYILYLAQLSPGSRPTQRCALRQVANWLGKADAELVAWHALTAADVATVRSRAVRLAPATGRRYMAALKGVLKEAWRSGALSTDAHLRLIDVPPIRGSRPPPGRALAPGELSALWITAGPRDRAVLAAMVGAGLRRAEVNTARLTTTATLAVLGKGDKLRNIAITGSVLSAVLAHPPPWRLSGNGVWAMLRRLGRRAGVAAFSPHDLRRTYASIALGAGVDLATVQAAMGHTSPTTTARYDRRTDAQAHSADLVAKALDRIERKG